MANTALILANPDFNSIEGSLKSFLKAQDRFKDYDFEGSNLATIINLLAYNTYQNDFIANMVASEMFMDTATQRRSIVSHAKELGYTPRSARAASAVLNIKIIPPEEAGVIIVPRGTMFNSPMGSRSYTFITDRAYTAYPINGVYEINDVIVYEGFNVVEQYVVQPYDALSGRQRYILSNTWIDTRSLRVSVDGVEYTYASTILDLGENSNVFFLEMMDDGRYEIVFGADFVGKQPVAQQRVVASYNVTVGADANGASIFRPSELIAGYTNIEVTTVTSAAGGAAPEDDESIRRYAPLMNQTRGRAVTSEDYKVLLKQEFPEIHAINVYGGEEVTPPQYGRVFISIDTKGALGASNGSKAAFERYIKAKTPVTVKTVFVDPTFMSLRVVSRIEFDYKNHTTTAEQVAAATLLAVDKFNEAELGDFDRTFLYSRFVNAIDNAHPAIISNDTTVELIALLDPALIEEGQRISLHNAVRPSTLTSSQFQFMGKTCTIVDDGTGSIDIVTVSNGETVVMLREVGSIDYSGGTIQLRGFEPEKTFGYGIRIYLTPVSKNVEAVQNVLLNVDTREIKLTAVPTDK